MVERIELIDNNENLKSVVFKDIVDYDENNDFKGISELDKFLNYFSNPKLTRNYILKYYSFELLENENEHKYSGFYYFRKKYENDKQCKRRIAEDSIYSVKKLVNLIKETASNNENLMQYFTEMKVHTIINNKVNTYKTNHSHSFKYDYYKINNISKWLRIYAVTTNKKDLIITGGYLKPSKKIQETYVGSNELYKIQLTYEYINNYEVNNDNS